MVNHGRHVFDAIGMTRVVIEDGKVASVGESELEYCPLFKKFRGMENITPEMVRKGVENAGAIDAIVDIEVNRREFGSSEGGHNILLEAIVHAVATGKPSIAR